MNWLIITLGTTVGGAIGWWIGAHVGIMTAFILSMVGTAVSFYYCRRFIAEYMP